MIQSRFFSAAFFERYAEVAILQFTRDIRRRWAIRGIASGISPS
jgi:hypothetical protein